MDYPTSVEQKLEEARQQLGTIFDTMQAGIILVTPQGTISFANRRMAAMFGCTLDELIGSNYPVHVHPDQRHMGDERMRKLIAGEIDHVHHERHYVRKDGSDFWGHLSGKRHEDSQGNLISLVGVIADITEMKRAQQVIQESEESYRSIIENMQDVYYRADSEGRLVMVSPSGVVMLGYDNMGQVLGCNIRDTFYYDPEERDAFLHNLRLKGAVSGYELTLKKRDGSPLPVAVSSRVLVASDGSFTGVEGVYHDMSQFRLAMDKLKASEDKFARVFNHAPILMTISIIEDGRYLEVNDRFCEISGFSREEAIGRTSLELGWISPDERKRIIAAFKRDSRVCDMEVALTARDGRQVFCLYSAERITIEGEDRLVSIALDITERKRAEEMRDYAIECFNQALGGPQHILYRLNVKKGCYDYMSPAFGQITGYPVAEFSQNSLEKLKEFFHPDDRVRVFDLIEEKFRLRTGATVNFDLEYRLRKADGNYCWLHDSTTACFDEQGDLDCFFGSALDVTERKCAEDALQESELKFRTLFATLQDAVFLTSAEDGLIVECNGKLSGYTREELIGKTSVGLGLWADMNERQKVVDLMTTKGGVNDFEALFRRKDGSVFPGSISTNPVSLNGRVLLLSVVRDISERNRFLTALQESEQRYRTLFDTMQEGFALHEIICDEAGKPVDYRFLQVNRAFEKLTGLSATDLTGRTVLEVMPATEPYWIESYGGVALTGEPALLEHYSRELGRHFEVHAYQPSPGRFAAVFSDVTERKILQQEREKAQRLSSLGLLAGGIAHDFNNILTGVIGNISIAAMLVGQEHKAAERLKECQDAARRAAELTQQLLTFSRGGEPLKRAVDTERLVNESISFSLRGSNVKGDFISAPGLWRIDADAGQMNQVLNNLLINARQAMERGGYVRVRAENCEIHRDDSMMLAPGRYVRIVVEDEGCGIPPAELDRIFDPYFTTKERGTGLGLTSVYSIVRRHGGHIEVASVAGRGAIFTLTLPAFDDTADETVNQEHEDAVVAGSGRILVMDDEEMIRGVACMMLEDCGYAVEACSDGSQAVELCARAREAGTPFDAVVLDLTVPGGMGGKEAAALIRQQDQDVVMIVSSGYSNDPVMADFRSCGFNGAVSKPYDVESLTGKLARLLAVRRRAG